MSTPAGVVSPACRAATPIDTVMARGLSAAARVERRRADPLADALRDDPALVERGVGNDDDDLLAAVARDEVDAPRQGADVLGAFPQDLVARVVAVRIVDGLEAVDVQQQHRHLAAATDGILEQHRKMHIQIAAVVQPGEARR